MDRFRRNATTPVTWCSPTTRAWLRAAGVQALFTLILCSISKYAEGRAWHTQAQGAAVLGVIATWTLALRAIREQLNVWFVYSGEMLRRASLSGRTFLQRRELNASMWRLRVIAASLTLPFFVLPLACAFAAAFYATQPGARAAWAIFALWTGAGAWAVAAYFKWSVAPALVPVRLNPRACPRHRARRWF